ncbi:MULTISPECIES: hypothetical protein [unclassified Streptomyces]|uniref:hypothetical protein n=1 Tax=unclassified Streptomyces TaxID=2593676 RepID=UPI001905B303|nr:hypothetical protein [Streptomyces sp. HSG2]
MRDNQITHRVIALTHAELREDDDGSMVPHGVPTASLGAAIVGVSVAAVFGICVASAVIANID